MIQNRKMALVFRLAGFVLALAGLLAHTGFLGGSPRPSRLMYYTIQSNILALVLFGMLCVRTAVGLKRDGALGSAGYFPRFEMVCVVDLLLTFLVYWVLLAPGSFSMGADSGLWAFNNLAVHAFTPLLVALDYVLFPPGGHLKYRDVYYVCIFPLCYVAFASVAGLCGYVFRISREDGLPVHYPYFFLDYDRVGAYSILYICGLLAFFLFISHMLYLADKRLKKTVLVPRRPQ